MPDIVVKNFKGVFERASKFDLPDVMAETCTDLLPSHEGKLVKRKGYETATLSKNTFGVTGLSGNIINIFELVTGRASTDGPDEAIKYLCQTDDSPGKLYLWNDETTTTAVWTQIDNSLTDFRDADGTVQKCRFLEEGGQVRVLVGNRSVNKPLWWGYCDQQFTNAISSNDGTKTSVSAGFLTNALLSNIPVPIIDDWITATVRCYEPSDADWDFGYQTARGEGLTKFGFSIEYSSRQYSAFRKFNINKVQGTYSEDAHTIESIQIKVSSTSFDRRITGVSLFSGFGSDLNDADLRFIDTLSLNNSYGTFDAPERQVFPRFADGQPIRNKYTSAVYNSTTKQFKFSGIDNNVVQNDQYNGCLLMAKDSTNGTIYYLLIKDTLYTDKDNQYFEINDHSSQTTGLVNSRTYYLKVISSWYLFGGYYYYTYVLDLSRDEIISLPDTVAAGYMEAQSVTEVYPKYGTTVNDQIFFAKVYHDSKQKDSLICYGLITNSGLFSNDVYAILNCFPVQTPINGISSIGDRLIVYGDTRIYRGIIPNSNESSWEFEKLFDEFGLLSSDSLVNINGRDYFLASDWDIKEFDGITQPKSIGAGIYDTIQTAGDSSITYLKTVVGFKMPKISMYCVRVQTGASSYQYWGYDLRNRAGWIQFSWASNFTGFFNGQNGDTYGFTATTLKKLNTGTDDDGTAITPVYKTAPLFLDKKTRIHLSQAVITYKSNTVIQIDFYLDGGSAITQVSDQLAAKTALGDGVKHLPLGSNGRYVQIGITIPSANQASNTYLEIDQLQLPVEVSGAEQ